MQRSIREELLGALHGFCSDAGFQAMRTNQVLADLVFHLSEYREEEVPLYPNLYLTEGGNEVFSAIAPAGERVSIGNCDIASSASKVLKECATLANDGWAIYLEMGSGSAEYGLFRTSDLPISVSAMELLRDPEQELEPVVVIRNCAARCVEMIDGRGNHLELSLTSAPPSDKPVSSQLKELAVSVTRDVVDPNQATLPYIERLLGDICQRSHGTIIAVLPTSDEPLPPEFGDGVTFLEPIDIGKSLSELHENRSAEALSRLHSHESLLKGMISSDGITILSTDAKVYAFRVFVKPTSEESQRMEGLDIRGGARTRAFELLRLRLGNPLEAVFLRSQDGKTDFFRGEQ